MKLRKLCMPFLVAAIMLFSVAACSNDDEKEEKGQIEQFTDRTAEKMIDYMGTPLEKAKGAADVINKRNEAIKEGEEERAK